MSGDMERRRVRASVAHELFGGDTEWPRAGRFEVVGKLGAGASGVVYKAYDPQLERHVALKLLNRDRMDRGRERFLREARALAKLSHPNIVTVHEVGDVDGNVFIATELIDGVDLRRWIDAAERDPRDVLRALVAAGHGLAAAHRAGIVHRDFKPANVMVGDDGRVCVVDFGLARSNGVVEPGDVANIDSPSVNLTATGAVVGTPSYMAPEQRRGEADARSDQFSFCVALYEAMYGARPFEGTTLDELIGAVEQGPPKPPTGARVPNHVPAAVMRGLAADPVDRHASMEALLVLLEHDPVRRRRRIMVAIAALIVVGGLCAAAVFGLRERQPSWQTRCDSAAESAAGELWNEDRAAALRDSFAASGHPQHAALFERTAAGFAAYAGRFRAAHAEACAATHVQGGQSQQLLDSRMQCLVRHRNRANALAVLLSDNPDQDTVAGAVAAAAKLGSLLECADVEWLRSEAMAPVPPELRDRVQALRGQLDQVYAYDTAGNDRYAYALIGHVVEASKALDYPPLYAEALYLFADLRDGIGESAEAEQDMHRAIRAASRAGDDRLSARTWISLLWIVGIELTQRDRVPTIRLSAEAALDRAGRPPDLDASLEYALGWMAYADRNLDDATLHLKSARDLLGEAHRASHPDILSVASALAAVLMGQGKYREALIAYDDVMVQLTSIFGEDAPRMSSVLGAMGSAHRELNELADALTAHRRALELAEQRFGPGSPSICVALSNLGTTLSDLGRHDEAVSFALRSVEILEAENGPDHPTVATALNALAGIHTDANDYEASVRTHRRALAIRAAALGADHYETGVSASNLATVLSIKGDHGEALAFARRALAIYEGLFGPDDLNHSYPLLSIGRALTNTGQAAQAIEPLERALRIRKAHGISTADSSFVLAQALWAANADRERANSLATQARDEHQASGESEAAAQVDAWIDERQ